MKGLFRKDIELLKGNFKIFAGIYLVALVFLFVYKNGEQMFTFYVTMISSILVLNTISYDEFENGMSFLMTLPVNRSTYVKSKYALGVIIGMGGWLLSFLVATVYANMKSPGRDWTEWLLVGMSSLIVIFFIIVVMIPLQLKFGGENSRMVMIAVFLGTFGGCYLIYTILEKLGVNVDALLLSVASLGAPMLLGIFAVIIAVSVLISMKISEKIINNKEY
ncbi:ABC-2 transporter permease [Blautia schinkii]|nr:ABC-2 transporter permease [Blautia schinkii]